MFSLIITIVSIALVVALVAATMYYGGDTLTQGRNSADAAAFVTGAQQISGAVQLHRALESEDPADVAALQASGHLNGAPVVKGTPLVFDTATGTVTSTVTSDAVCEAINTQSNGNGIYECDTDDNTFVYNF